MDLNELLNRANVNGCSNVEKLIRYILCANKNIVLVGGSPEDRLEFIKSLYGELGDNTVYISDNDDFKDNLLSRHLNLKYLSGQELYYAGKDSYKYNMVIYEPYSRVQIHSSVVLSNISERSAIISICDYDSIKEAVNYFKDVIKKEFGEDTNSYVASSIDYLIKIKNVNGCIVIDTIMEVEDIDNTKKIYNILDKQYYNPMVDSDLYESNYLYKPVVKYVKDINTYDFINPISIENIMDILYMQKDKKEFINWLKDTCTYSDDEVINHIIKVNA